MMARWNLPGEMAIGKKEALALSNSRNGIMPRRLLTKLIDYYKQSFLVIAKEIGW
jgi:hypothetical protein